MSAERDAVQIFDRFVPALHFFGLFGLRYATRDHGGTDGCAAPERQGGKQRLDRTYWA